MAAWNWTFNVRLAATCFLGRAFSIAVYVRIEFCSERNGTHPCCDHASRIADGCRKAATEEGGEMFALKGGGEPWFNCVAVLRNFFRRRWRRLNLTRISPYVLHVLRHSQRLPPNVEHIIIGLPFKQRSFLRSP